MSQADEDQPLEPLPATEEAALLETLEAALRPGELAAALNERLIEMALEDPLAAASAEELAESQRLRQALDGLTPHEDAALLSALRSAAEPEAESDAHEAVEKALAAIPAGGRGAEGPSGRGRGNVVYAAFGAASVVLAAAAVLVLFIGTARKSEAPSAAATTDYAVPRTTAPLFSEPFATGDTTARIDTIASARAHDLRGNRYASWGVR